MNRLYKLAWSPRTRSMVAVSELAKGRKKGTTLRGAIAAIVIGLTCGTASAATDTSVETCGENADESSVCVANGKQQSRTIIAPDEAFIGPNGNGISIAHGTGNVPLANADGDIAIGGGGSANSGDDGNGNYATGIGDAQSLNAAGTTAIGNWARANFAGATVIGGSQSLTSPPTAGAVNTLVIGNGTASGANGVMIGVNTAASPGTNSVALGSEAQAHRDNVVALTSNVAPLQIVNVANGSALTDAVNISQLTSVIDGLGGLAQRNPTTTSPYRRTPSQAAGICWVTLR